MAVSLSISICLLKMYFYCQKLSKTNLQLYFDPYGNATHTALSTDLVGEDVLITGAGIGIMAAAIARKAGARNVVITDMNEYQLNLPIKWERRALST